MILADSDSYVMHNGLGTIMHKQLGIVIGCCALEPFSHLTAVTSMVDTFGCKVDIIAPQLACCGRQQCNCTGSIASSQPRKRSTCLTFLNLVKSKETSHRDQ